MFPVISIPVQKWLFFCFDNNLSSIFYTLFWSPEWMCQDIYLLWHFFPSWVYRKPIMLACKNLSQNRLRTTFYIRVQHSINFFSIFQETLLFGRHSHLGFQSNLKLMCLLTQPPSSTKAGFPGLFGVKNPDPYWSSSRPF